MAYRVIGIRAIADEIAQEVLLKAWRSFDAYDPKRGSVATYLNLIARHHAMDCVRSNGARSRRDLQLVPNEHNAASVPETALAGIEQRVVWETLATLRPDQRQPIVLAFFGGMSYRAVAAQLDLPEGTVKSRIRKGMQAMAQQLQSHRRFQPQSTARDV